MAMASLFLPVVLNSFHQVLLLLPLHRVAGGRCIGERQSNIEKKNQKEERNSKPKRVTEILWKEILKINKQSTDFFVLKLIHKYNNG